VVHCNQLFISQGRRDIKP